MSNKLILTILLMLFLPSNAFAESVSYEFITSMMSVSENFILTLFNQLATSFHRTFLIIATLCLTFSAVKWFFGKPDIVGIIKLFLGIIIINVLVFQKGFFEEWIYHPIMETVYALPVFVIKVSAGLNASSSSTDSLKAMLSTMDKVIQNMREVASLIMEEKGFLSSTWIFLQGLIINLLYLGLFCVFVVMFSLGIIAAHVMLTVAPFALSLLPFEQLRGLSFNVMRAFFSYSFIPFFASVAMGMTLAAITSLNNEATAILELGDVNSISDHFFLQAIILGVFSWFFHIKSSEFASQTIGGQVSSFGSMFATGMGVAAAGTKMATTKAALPMISKARQGIGRVGEAASKMRERMWGG